MQHLLQSSLGQDTMFGFLHRELPSAQLFNPQLVVNNDDQTMLAAIRRELHRCDRFEFSVAFITSSALALLKQDLLDFSGTGVIYTSTYLDFNDPSVFRELLTLPNVEVRVLDDSVDAFHSKGYLFHQHGQITAIIGSSNLTRKALLANDEWNIRFSAFPDGDIAIQLGAAVERLQGLSSLLDLAWIERYEQQRAPQMAPQIFEGAVDQVVPVGKISPNLMQQEALENIKRIYDAGENRALVISATGTGKTILAALAARQAKPKKMLFLVHREQILDKAITEFQRVLEAPDDAFGKFVGNQRSFDAQYVFATVQTLSRPETLSSIPKDSFDYIIIDEVHRAGAQSYQRLIEYLQPKFLLGLTATPERTDDFNVFELFNFNVAYEIRLQRALESQMLVPFSYYGVSDYTDAEGNTVDDTSSLARVVDAERVKYVLQMMEQYGHAQDVKGLIFCGRNEEAKALSEIFNASMVHGRRLRTRALSGSDSQEERDAVVKQLEAGELDYVLSVDIFNEGIDIPAINQVVMLRNTQSAIVFTQQLGRGLRKSAGKDHLRVIDFIGNYSNNFLIPIALFGNKTKNKDDVKGDMKKANEKGSIAGLSSVSFDKIAQQRILDSLNKARIGNLKNLAEAYKELEYRLGRPVWRYDFAVANTADPVVIASGREAKNKNYWHFLQRIKKTDEVLSATENAYLSFLDYELLNGKRPHELLLLRALLAEGKVTKEQLVQLLEQYGASVDEATIRSALRVLRLEFHVTAEQEAYLNQPLVRQKSNIFSLEPAFEKAYRNNAYFRAHVDDVIETGLWLNRHLHMPSGEMIIGHRYSRKDVCRLLNWSKNQYSTMYGYKTDDETKTCPIFITHHKAEDISASTKYEDGFDNESTVHWYTKSKRRLDSPVENAIINEVYKLHVFVKKDDAEGVDFYYLGTATPRDAEQTTISNGDGKDLPIVNMRLDLAHPVDLGLYAYFQG